MASPATNRLPAFFSLFLSVGTLLCCALPAALVTLGMGAALAGLVGAFPAITVISENKDAVFIAAAVMLSLAWLLERRATALDCPTDPAQAEACQTSRRRFPAMLAVSTFLCATGAFFAYLAPFLI